ncbi:MAG TPA: N-acetylmuramoyl-L-alanine amidase, partial [Candidatus Caenarcaniphilales bacterium]
QRLQSQPALTPPRPPAISVPMPPQPVSVPVPPAAPLPPSVQPSPPERQTPKARAIVVIDPGHGGPDPGAIGIGGLRETDVVLPIALEVVSLLQKQGVQAILTRADELRDVDLPPRVALAQGVKADVFVSIHANSINLSRTDISGLETYYYSNGARLARVIHNSILQEVGVRDRGVRRARFYVLRKTSMPAVLVETGFVTGAEDAPRLANPESQRQMAAAIARGILQYLNISP